MGALDFMASSDKAKNAISPLKDPFGQELINRINISIDNKPIFGPPRVRCNVYFQNGNTKGQQDFEGPELAPLMVEVQAFIESLKR